jgi:hypothetical protein
MFTFWKRAAAATVQSFRQLAQAPKDSLKDVKVFLVAKGADKDAYIVGRTEAGWAGLKTRVVQT